MALTMNQLVVGMFGAPAGNLLAGLEFAYGDDIASAAADFAANDLFPYDSVSAMVDALLAGTDVDAVESGARAWAESQTDVAAAAAVAIEFLLTTEDEAFASAKAQFTNKVAVAEYYSTGAAMVTFSDLATSQALLASVTADEASVTAITEAPVVVEGSTFTLTTGDDTKIGTEGDDSFSGTVAATGSTYTTNDIIADGFDGDNDTLTITASANVTTGPKVSGIENVVINSNSFADLTVDMSSVVASNITVNNTQAGGSTVANVTVDADSAMTVNAGSGVKTLTVDEGDVGKLSTTINAGSATTVNAGASGAAGAGEKFNASITAASATAINVEGTASTSDAVSISAAGTVALNTNSDGTGTDQVENITLSGAAAALTATVNASDAVEKLTLAGDQDVTVKIGADDIAGETVTDSTTAGTTTVEIVTKDTDNAGNQDTVDLTLVGSDVILLSTDVNVDDAASADDDFVQVASGATVQITSDQTGAVKTKGTASANELNIETVTKSGAASNASYTIKGTGNVDTVNVTVGEDVTINNFSTTATVTATGASNLTLGATATAKSLDASAMTGKVNATANSSLKSIATGSGDDTIVGYNGDMTLDLGEGTDKLQIGSSISLADDTVSLTGLDIIEITAAGATTLTMSGSDLVDSGIIVKGTGTKDALVVTMDTAATDLSSLVIDTATMSGVTINGNAGAVASEAQVITGTNAADTVNAGTQNTTVNGGASDDTINGGTGNDNLNGDAGNDTIDAGAGNDTINGGAGADSLKGNSGNDTISGDAGNDDLLGDSGTDTLSGGDDDDILNGGADKDSLNGGAGVDFMIGGAGADTMTGGAGVDTFAYASAGVVTIAEDTAGANGVKEVQTVTISGTFAAGETITLTDTASETAAYTVLQGDSASDIAAGLKAAADTAAGGGTFDVFTATVSGAVITLTEAVAGGNDLAAVTSASTNAQAANTDASIAVASGTVSGYDVITDFNSSEDKILLGGSNALAGVAAASPTAGANAKISTNAVATFAETDDTLAEIIATLVADTTNVANNEVVTFEFDGNTYIYGAGGTAGGATDYMIELTGVTDLGTASISSGMLSFS